MQGACRRYDTLEAVLTELLYSQNVALGAFLPQSVSAFASEIPSSLYTKKGLRAMLD